MATKKATKKTTKKSMNKGGRPRKTITDEQLDQLQKLASVLNQDQIADFFGMSRTTFYEIMNRDPAVFERYKKGKSSAIAKVAQTLIQEALDGNTTAMIFYLKTQAGWRETIVNELQSDGLIIQLKK